jgi:3-oxoacyl-[acyl-carrier protein] reductase
MMENKSMSKSGKRVALVTGAGRNIGREIALGLAQAGVAVAVNVRASVDEGQAVVDEIVHAGGDALLCVGDVSDAKEVAKMVAGIAEKWGRLDILVNNAAIRREAGIDDISLGDWSETLRVILDGAFLCTQAALTLLRSSGQGAIVNIGGMTAHTGAARRVHVVTAKAGLVGFTRALAHDLAPDGVTVNCVAPGLIDTVRKDSATKDPHHRRRQTPLLGAMGTPRDVAEAVVWVSGTAARYVTGQVIHVNGGTYLGG